MLVTWSERPSAQIVSEITGETCYNREESVRLRAYVKDCEKKTLDLSAYKKMYYRCDEDSKYTETCNKTNGWVWPTIIASIVVSFFAGVQVGGN